MKLFFITLPLDRFLMNSTISSGEIHVRANCSKALSGHVAAPMVVVIWLCCRQGTTTVAVRRLFAAPRCINGAMGCLDVDLVC